MQTVSKEKVVCVTHQILFFISACALKGLLSVTEPSVFHFYRQKSFTATLIPFRMLLSVGTDKGGNVWGTGCSESRPPDYIGYANDPSHVCNSPADFFRLVATDERLSLHVCVFLSTHLFRMSDIRLTAPRTADEGMADLSR